MDKWLWFVEAHLQAALSFAISVTKALRPAKPHENGIAL
jgi:hypothetical protein